LSLVAWLTFTSWLQSTYHITQSTSIAEPATSTINNNVVVDSNSQTQAAWLWQLWLRFCLVVFVVSLSQLGQQRCLALILTLVPGLDACLSFLGLDSVIHGPLCREKTFTAW
jgi:hypothetical protein